MTETPRPYKRSDPPSLPGSDRVYLDNELRRIEQAIRGLFDQEQALETLINSLSSDLSAPSSSAALTVTTTVGSLTDASASVNYKQFGKYVFFDATLTITTNGTGAGTLLLFDFPFTALREGVAYGREDASNGSALSCGFALGGGMHIDVYTYDHNYPGADGRRFRISGFCEVA